MPEWVIMLIAQAFTAGAIYGAIRGDIKSAIMRADNAKECAEDAHDSASDAHRRIDHMLMRGSK